MFEKQTFTTEELACRYRRMQRGLALEDDRRAERIAARASFDEIEAGSNWTLWIGCAVSIVGVIYFGTTFLRGNKTIAHDPARMNFPPSVVAQPAMSPAICTPRPGVSVYEPQTVAGYRPEIPTTAPRALPAVPAPAPAVNHDAPPAPDYAARDRHVVQLKREADALDDFVRQIRNNPYANHYAEPGQYVYHAWKYTRGNLLIQERFDPYMKWIDQRRDEVRREKWQLEGR